MAGIISNLSADQYFKNFEYVLKFAGIIQF